MVPLCLCEAVRDLLIFRTGVCIEQPIVAFLHHQSCRLPSCCMRPHGRNAVLLMYHRRRAQIFISKIAYRANSAREARSWPASPEAQPASLTIV
jgi:hypothetical protein